MNAKTSSRSGKTKRKITGTILFLLIISVIAFGTLPSCKDVPAKPSNDTNNTGPSNENNNFEAQEEQCYSTWEAALDQCGSVFDPCYEAAVHIPSPDEACECQISFLACAAAVEVELWQCLIDVGGTFDSELSRCFAQCEYDLHQNLMGQCPYGDCGCIDRADYIRDSCVIGCSEDAIP